MRCPTDFSVSVYRIFFFAAVCLERFTTSQLSSLCSFSVTFPRLKTPIVALHHHLRAMMAICQDFDRPSPYHHIAFIHDLHACPIEPKKFRTQHCRPFFLSNCRVFESTAAQFRCQLLLSLFVYYCHTVSLSSKRPCQFTSSLTCTSVHFFCQ